MQKLGCQLAFSVRAIRAGKYARLSTDVVQSDGRKTMLPFVLDVDDGGHTWLGKTDFFSASDTSSYHESFDRS